MLVPEVARSVERWLMLKGRKKSRASFPKMVDRLDRAFEHEAQGLEGHVSVGPSQKPMESAEQPRLRSIKGKQEQVSTLSPRATLHFSSFSFSYPPTGVWNVIMTYAAYVSAEKALPSLYLCVRCSICNHPPLII